MLLKEGMMTDLNRTALDDPDKRNMGTRREIGSARV